MRAGTLVAQGLDVAKGTLTGEPVTLADGVVVDASSRRSAVSVAATGLVAYRTGGARSAATDVVRPFGKDARHAGGIGRK